MSPILGWHTTWRLQSSAHQIYSYTLVLPMAGSFFCPVLRTVHYASLSLPHSTSAVSQMVWIQLSLEQVVQKHNSREPLLQQRGFFPATAVVNLPETWPGKSQQSNTI